MRIYLIKRSSGEQTFSPITLRTDLMIKPVPWAWRVPGERVDLSRAIFRSNFAQTP